MDGNTLVHEAYGGVADIVLQVEVEIKMAGVSEDDDDWASGDSSCVKRCRRVQKS